MPDDGIQVPYFKWQEVSDYYYLIFFFPILLPMLPIFRSNFLGMEILIQKNNTQTRG